MLFDSFSFVTDVVTVKGNGEVSLPADPRLSDAVMLHVGITVIGHRLVAMAHMEVMVVMAMTGNLGNPEMPFDFGLP